MSTLNCRKPPAADDSPPSTPPSSPRLAPEPAVESGAPAQRSSNASSTAPRSNTPRMTNALVGKQVLRESRNETGPKRIDAAVASFDAPLRTIADEDLAKLVRDLRRDIQFWQHPAQSFDGMPPDFRTRCADASSILGIVAEPDEHNVGYYVGERLAGLMLMGRAGDDMEISIIATHPGTTGGGGALIEHAVNFAEENGCQGRVKLAPLDGALDAYCALGFQPTGQGNYLRVDPRQSEDQWAQKDGKWRLRKHQDQTYLTAMKQTAPLPASAD